MKRGLTVAFLALEQVDKVGKSPQGVCTPVGPFAFHHVLFFVYRLDRCKLDSTDVR